jgi:hypothetical protein
MDGSARLDLLEKRSGSDGGMVDLFVAFDPGLKHVVEAREKAQQERGRESEDKKSGQAGDSLPDE